MDKNYIGKTLVLPHTTHEKLMERQDALMKELGFKPSLSETVAWLCNNVPKITPKKSDKPE